MKTFFVQDGKNHLITDSLTLLSSVIRRPWRNSRRALFQGDGTDVLCDGGTRMQLLVEEHMFWVSNKGIPLFGTYSWPGRGDICVCKVDNGKVNYVCVLPKVTLGVRTLEVKLVEIWHWSGLSNCSLEYYRSEEHTSELQSRVDISYAVFCLKKIFFLMIRRPPRSTRSEFYSPTI